MPTLRMICVLSLCVIFQASSASQTNSLQKPEQGAVLARLSYTSTYVVNGNDQKSSPRICFELYRDGQYRIVRATTKGNENRAGKLSQDQFETMSKMLTQLDSNSSPEGVIRKGSESFVAEVANGAEQEKRLLWVDPDHQRPFPESVAKIIGWLRNFNSEDALPLNVPELSTDPICPRISQTPLEPANWHTLSNDINCRPQIASS